MKRVRYAVGSATDTGMVRKINQDNLLVRVHCVNDDEIGCFAIADGMGGLSGGETASLTAVSYTGEWLDNQLLEVLEREEFLGEACFTYLEELFRKINSAILAYATAKNITMGTTFSLLFIFRQKFYILHAGDTRIYKAGRRKIFLLTEDETWVARRIKEGILTDSDAAYHEKKHILVNCLGVFDCFTIFKSSGKAEQNDIFLICSDGFYNLVSDAEALKHLHQKKDVQDIANALVSLAKERGGFDNISVIVVKLIKG